MQTIADRISRSMIKQGLKQVDIVKSTGINKAAISSYLSGRYEPKSENLIKLATTLKVDVQWLMGLEGGSD